MEASMRTRLAILVLAGSAALGGCAYGYGDYGPYGGMSVGVGYGSGYGGYGYGGYYDPYGYGGYNGYGGYGYGGYGYGDPYFGWYDNYYYPGTGYYVYDQYRRPHVWSNTQRQYWTQRRDRALNSGRTSRMATNTTTTTAPSPQLRDNWSGFDRRSSATTARTDRQQAREQRQQAREQRQAVRDQRRDDRNPRQ
jgi:hypothetical protein